MKVILLRDVPGTGKKGDTKDVADGFGRNYLLPQRLAVLATKGSVQDFQTLSQQAEASRSREHGELVEIADRINGKKITFRAKVGAKDRLFGSITNADIAKSATELSGFDVDKRHVDLKDPIRTLGEHEVNIRLGKDINAKVTVVVEPEKG